MIVSFVSFVPLSILQILQIHHYNLLRPEAEKETASSQHVTKIIREDTWAPSFFIIIQKITASYL
jgi:hypothetical protein